MVYFRVLQWYILLTPVSYSCVKERLTLNVLRQTKKVPEEKIHNNKHFKPTSYMKKKYTDMRRASEKCQIYYSLKPPCRNLLMENTCPIMMQTVIYASAYNVYPIMIHKTTYYMPYNGADGDKLHDLLCTLSWRRFWYTQWPTLCHIVKQTVIHTMTYLERNVNYAGRVLWIYLNGSKIGKEIVKEKFKRVE